MPLEPTSMEERVQEGDQVPSPRRQEHFILYIFSRHVGQGGALCVGAL